MQSLTVVGQCLSLAAVVTHKIMFSWDPKTVAIDQTHRQTDTQSHILMGRSPRQVAVVGADMIHMDSHLLYAHSRSVCLHVSMHNHVLKSCALPWRPKSSNSTLGTCLVCRVALLLEMSCGPLYRPDLDSVQEAATASMQKQWLIT